MKQKFAKIIRILTVPPIEVFVMLTILYKKYGNIFASIKEYFVAILFLAVIPMCAYILPAKSSDKENARNHQRNLAFAFNFLSYLMAILIGYFASFSHMLLQILTAYFLSVLLLTFFNKVVHIRASGHACSCTLPYLILSFYFGRIALLICLILYFAEFWASVELKRHTKVEFLLGSLTACLIFACTLCM